MTNKSLHNVKELKNLLECILPTLFSFYDG